MIYSTENQKIVKNTAKCLHCGNVLISEGQYDKQVCSCKHLIIAGGQKGLIRFKMDEDSNIRNAILNKDYQEMSEFLLVE